MEQEKIEAVMKQIEDLLEYDFKMLRKRADVDGADGRADALYLDYINNYGIKAIGTSILTQYHNCKDIGLDLNNEAFRSMLREAMNEVFLQANIDLRVGDKLRVVPDLPEERDSE